MNKAMIVEVSNRHENKEVNEALLEQAVQRIVHDNGFEAAEISVAVVDDEEMHQLNIQFLEHDYPTDVLSFPLSKSTGFLAGEIIVSLDTAEREAPAHQLSLQEELLLYVIHGALHLVGYDDKQVESRKTMREQERHFMRQLGIDYLPVDQEATDTGP